MLPLIFFNFYTDVYLLRQTFINDVINKYDFVTLTGNIHTKNMEFKAATQIFNIDKQLH